MKTLLREKITEVCDKIEVLNGIIATGHKMVLSKNITSAAESMINQIEQDLSEIDSNDLLEGLGDYEKEEIYDFCMDTKETLENNRKYISEYNDYIFIAEHLMS